jgi:hypothetical protein
LTDAISAATRGRPLFACYAKSLLWVSLFLAASFATTLIVETTFVDFVYGNPHRTQANALLMIPIILPVIGIFSLIGSFLVFAVPQTFQAILIDLLVSRFSTKADMGVLLALPLTSLLTWYCYDYLTPSDFNLGINSDSSPYRHGLTIPRYLTALSFQLPVTLFSYLYWKTFQLQRHRRTLIATGLTLAVIAGVYLGIPARPV